MPLENLIDNRFVEGTYPLFDTSSSPEKYEEGERGDNERSVDDSLEPPERWNLEKIGQPRIRRSKTSSCFGGLFDPSLELGVHLYRMGPLNNYSSRSSVERARAAAPDQNEARSSGGDRGPVPSPPAVLWKPPSLIERGKVGLDGCGCNSAVSLFARPQTEAKIIGDASSDGEGAGG